MEIILQIPPQPLTLNEARSMTVLGMDFQNAIITEARDGKLPAQIRFTENDPFPWGQLLQKLAVLWQLSQNDAISKDFRLKNKLPQQIVDLLPQVAEKDSLNVLKQLGSAEFICAFSKF